MLKRRDYSSLWRFGSKSVGWNGLTATSFAEKWTLKKTEFVPCPCFLSSRNEARLSWKIKMLMIKVITRNGAVLSGSKLKH